MELKVWVDDVQRIVCGVNPTTTCHDVVLALAVATGQTGRFTLIEKFRNNERLLSPSEKPFQILNKWTEYANDVQFIMKKSPPILHPSSHNAKADSQSNVTQNSAEPTRCPSKTTRLGCSSSPLKSRLNSGNNNNEEETPKVTHSLANSRNKIGKSPSQPYPSVDSCANNSSSTLISHHHPPSTLDGKINEPHNRESRNDLKSPSCLTESSSLKERLLHMGQSPSRKYSNVQKGTEGINRDLNGNTQKYFQPSSPNPSPHSNGLDHGVDRCTTSQTSVSRASIQLASPNSTAQSSGSYQKNGDGIDQKRPSSQRYVSRIELNVGKFKNIDDNIIDDRKLVSAREGPRFAKLVEEMNDHGNHDSDEVVDQVQQLQQQQFPIHQSKATLTINSRPRNPPSYNEAVQRSSIYSSTSSSSPSPCFQGTSGEYAPTQAIQIQQGVIASQEEDFSATGHTSPVRPVRKPKVPKVMFSPSSSSSSLPGSHSKNKTVATVNNTTNSPKLISANNRIDPLRFVSTMQRNALIEEEIVESVELHEPQFKESILMKSKMKEMMEAWKENEAELEALEIEFKKKKERDSKHKEILQLREQSSELESKISFTKHKIQLLSDQIREEEHKMEMNQRKAEMEEKGKSQSVIEKLKNDIRLKEMEFEDQENQLKHLGEEIKELDQQLESKTIQVDSILSDIKKENIAGLTVEPSIQLQLLSAQLSNDSVVAKLHSEVTKGPTCGENYFYNRIGSTRKMLGYPRELETAVATMKNPNGVWV